jgi:hypothetical protein
MSEEPRDETGRRTFLKRAAIVGTATVWVTPVIQSLGPAAYAQGTPPGRCYAIKWDPKDGCEDADGQVFCITPPPDQQPGGCEQGVTFTSDTNWTATLPPGCVFIQGCSKCAEDLCNCDTQITPNPDGSTTVTFFPCGVHAVSHIELIYCC